MATRRSASSLAAAVAAIAALVLVLIPGVPHTQTTLAAAGTCPPLLDREFSRLQTGKPESLCQYRGKVLLIVNTASYCGYTHQYEGLEALYRKYKDRGLVVLGFPSNDFGAQEPGSNKEIAEFCRLTYGVEFPMFEKSSVASLRTNPLYADLLTHYGAAAIPCRVADPDRKGKVERSVGHAKQTPLKGLRFESLAEAQAYLDR